MNENPNEIENPVSFEEYVALILRGVSTMKSTNNESPLIIEIISFSDDYTLSPVYKIEGIEYCDNGLFNDEIAGDNVYTSVDFFSNTGLKSTQIVYHKSESLIYQEELDQYLGKRLKKFKFGCDVRLAKCPNTNWLNTSLFGEPCIEFTNCYFEVEL